MKISTRIQYLIKCGYLMDVRNPEEFDSQNLKDFFINRNKNIKEQIINIWKI